MSWKWKIWEGNVLKSRSTDFLDVAESKFSKREPALHIPMMAGKISRLKYFPNCFWDSVTLI
jgi:hypothetical protein